MTTSCTSSGYTYMSIEWDGISSLYLWVDDCLEEQISTISIQCSEPYARTNDLSVPTSISKYDMKNFFDAHSISEAGTYTFAFWYSGAEGGTGGNLDQFHLLEFSPEQSIKVIFPLYVANVSSPDESYLLLEDGQWHGSNGELLFEATTGYTISRIDITGDYNQTVIVNSDSYTFDYTGFTDIEIAVIVEEAATISSVFPVCPYGRLTYHCTFDNCVCTSKSASGWTINGDVLSTCADVNGETPSITFYGDFTRVKKINTSTNTQVGDTYYPSSSLSWTYTPEAILGTSAYKLLFEGNGSGNYTYNVALNVSGTAGGNTVVVIGSTQYTSSTTKSYSVGGGDIWTIRAKNGYTISAIAASSGLKATITYKNTQKTEATVEFKSFSTSNQTINVIFTGSAVTTYTITTQIATGYENVFTISPSGKVNVSSGGSQEFTITDSQSPASHAVLIDNLRIDEAAPSSYEFTNVTSSHTIIVGPWNWSNFRCVWR